MLEGCDAADVADPHLNLFFDTLDKGGVLEPLLEVLGRQLSTGLLALLVLGTDLWVMH